MGKTEPNDDKTCKSEGATNEGGFAMHISWSADEVDKRLHQIMHAIHAQCVKYGTEPDG